MRLNKQRNRRLHNVGVKRSRLAKLQLNKPMPHDLRTRRAGEVGQRSSS
jgi:hypothetical protein